MRIIVQWVGIRTHTHTHTHTHINKNNCSTQVRHRAGSRDSVRWNHYIWKSVNNKDADWLSLTHRQIMFVSNANPLHYYVLLIPLKVDRWRWVWSIFESRTAWADHITCGMKYLYTVQEKVEVRMTVSVTVCVVLLCCVGWWWWWKEGRRWNPVPAHSLLLSKGTKGAARLNVPIDGRGRIAINSTICLLNIHTAEGFGI